VAFKIDPNTFNLARGFCDTFQMYTVEAFVSKNERASIILSVQNTSLDAFGRNNHLYYCMALSNYYGKK